MYGYSNPTIRSTEEGEQVGPKMHRAVKLARSGPVGDSDVYGSMKELAEAVGPNGSVKYGYRIVKRTVRKGLLALESDHDDATPSGRGAVVITEKGERYLNNND